MLRIKGTEVVSHHLQIAGRLRGGIRHPLAVAPVLSLHPAVDGVLHIEHGAGMGTTPDRTEGNAQGIGHRVGQATISAGSDIQKMNATFEQKMLELAGGCTAYCTIQRIVLEKTITEQPMAFEHAPGEQRPHVEGAHPGLLKNVLRKVETQFSPGETLRLVKKIGLVLER